ncbi:MAG: alpha/beta fold hydrolase [Marmoricola sp.]
MRLHTTTYGDGGSPIVFCHGLFGQGRNWTAVAKALADEHRTVLVDLPHHGRSPWPEHFDYVDVADELVDLLAELFGDDDPVTLVGHSMGGKAAMVTALRAPERVRRLCVVDIAPVDYRGRSEFEGYIEAMQALDLGSLGRRADAESALEQAVPDRTVRDFLLQNLRRDGDGWRWQVNLDVLGRDLDVLGSWPADRLEGVAPYEGPVLWVAGADSRYVRSEHDEAMRRLFPRTRKVVVKDAGHWVHAQRPEVVVEALRQLAA